MWVCTMDAGGILISIQRRTILLARPEGRGRRFFRAPFLPSTPMTPTGWASVAIFQTFAKAWENYVNVVIPTKYVEKRRHERGSGTVRADRNATLLLTDVNIWNLTVEIKVLSIKQN